MLVPGAEMSGAYRPRPSPTKRTWPSSSAPSGRELSYCSPPDEKLDRCREVVVEPTPMTHGAVDAGPTDISDSELPAANTTVTPTSCRAFVATLVGSIGSNVRYELPHELLTTRMLYSSLLVSRSSKAAMIVNMKTMSPVPYPMTSAPGATPISRGSSVPSPAAMPATWVPWPDVSALL